MVVLRILKIQAARTILSHEEDMKLLTFIRDRFPPRNDTIPVFAASIFIVYSWAILWFLQKMPGWLPFLSLWAILSILAYTLAFALLESCAVLLVLVLFGVLTPYKLIRARFISQGSVILFAAASWTAFIQLLRGALRMWSLSESILWFGIAILSIVCASVLVYRMPRFQQALRSLCTRLSIFLYIYVPIGIISCMVVLVRNILAAV